MGIENKATKSGNVNDATVWSLGRVPQAGDDVYANGFTVSLNVSATADTWNTTAGPTAIAGGGFSQTTSGITLTGDVWAGSTSCVTVPNTTGFILYVVGDCYGSRTNQSVTGAVLQNTANPTTVYITGNLYAGYLASSRALYCNGVGAVAYVDGYAVGSDYPGGSASVWAEALGGNGIVYIGGLVCGAYGAQPTSGNNRLFLNTVSTALPIFELRESINGPVAYLSDVDAPAVADVRAGVVYYGGGKTGTCAVPAAQYVLPGVPVDNTVGTAVVSADLTPVLNDTAAILADTTALLAQAGDGPLAVTIQTGVALSLVRVNSLGGDWTVTADNSGDAVFYLAAGDYTATAFASGYTWAAQAFTASDGLAVDYPGTPLSIPTPSSPDLCVCQLSLLDALSEPLTALPANSTFRVISNPLGSEHDWKNSNTAIPSESFAAGVVTLELPRGATIEWNIPGSLRAVRFVVPDQPSCIVMPIINV